MQSKETDLEVGRWGEELVYRFLMQHQKDSDQAWQVLWVNQAFNTGTPYDICIRQAVVAKGLYSHNKSRCSRKLVVSCNLLCMISLIVMWVPLCA